MSRRDFETLEKIESITKSSYQKSPDASSFMERSNSLNPKSGG